MSRTFRKPSKIQKGKKVVKDDTPTRWVHSCENNGGCPYCESNRLHNNRKKEEKANYDIKDECI